MELSNRAVVSAEPSTTTPLDIFTNRIADQTNQCNNMRDRLESYADSLFGAEPEACEPPSTGQNVRSGQIGAIDDSLDSLEQIVQNLLASVNRIGDGLNL
ncbi:MAG: hypothetical protein GY938_22935 [Ketobacter sp.]|nr:hypothetical protein [Ketobacter sp.]